MKRLSALVLMAFCLAGWAALAGAAQGPAVPGALRLPQALWADGAQAFSGGLEARVSMRMVKHARILAEKALELPASASSWPGGGAPRVLPLAVADMGGFNEARLDYVTGGQNRCGTLGIVAELRRGDDRALFVSDPLEPVDHLGPEWADGRGRESVPVAQAQWVGKGLRYQLSRLLDREPDDLWRISQDGLSTFLQRRFRKSLLTVGAIDVVLLRGQDVQVNLVVSLDEQGKGKTVLDWYAIPKRTFDLGDGRSLLRLYVGRHLRDLAPGARAVSLKEMALMFFKENKEDVARDRNLEKVLFVPSGLPDSLTERGLPRHLPARAREVFSGRGELAANLGIFAEPAWREHSLASLSLVQSPQDPDLPFEQAVETARLVRVAPRRDVPALLAATEDRCASFGASCDLDRQDGFVSQDPLWSLDLAPLARSGHEGGPLHPALTGGLFKAEGRLGFSSAADGLLVERAGSDPGGQGFVLETGASFTPEPGRKYGVWLELGRSREGLSGVEAEAYGQGESVRMRVNPGLAAWFPRLPGKVEGVRLLFSSQAPEMAVTLRKAVVQRLDPAAPRTDLFQARFLFDETRPLKVERSAPNAFSLSGQGPAFQPQWLVLDVSTTAWTVNDSRPSLKVSLNSGKGHSVALSARQARMAFYLPALGAPDDVGRGIHVSLAGGAPGATLEVAGASLSGQRLAAWPEVLEGEPLLEQDGKQRPLAELDAAGAARMASEACWLPMGGVSFSSGAGGLKFAKNQWLEVEALLVKDASGPALASLGREAVHPAKGKTGWGNKALAAIGLAGLSAVLWLFGIRRGGAARVLAACVQWLEENPSRSGLAGARAWLALAAGLAVGAVLVGPEWGRAIGVAATATAVPVWRACRPGLSRRFPVLAKSLAVHYCTGFLVAAALAALVRLAGAGWAAEFPGLAGLWLFCAALAAAGHDRQGKPHPAGSSQ